MYSFLLQASLIVYLKTQVIDFSMYKCVLYVCINMHTCMYVYAQPNT